MSYGKLSRAAIANAFKCARRQIRLHGYICIVLDEWKPYGHVLADKIIRNRMGPPPPNTPPNGYALETWLRHTGAVSLGASLDPHDMLVYRRRWLDELIKEFSA